MRILELNTVISKDYRKYFLECFVTQLIGEPVKYTFNTFLRSILKKEDQHKVAFSEYKSQQHFSGASGTFYGIHLNDRKIRIRFGKDLEIFNCSSTPEFVFEVCKHSGFLPSGSVFDLLGKIHISDEENVVVYVGV